MTLAGSACFLILCCEGAGIHGFLGFSVSQTQTSVFRAPTMCRHCAQSLLHPSILCSYNSPHFIGEDTMVQSY